MLHGTPTGPMELPNVHGDPSHVDDDRCSLAGTVLNDAHEDAATIVEGDFARRGRGHTEKWKKKAQTEPGPWDDMTHSTSNAWKHWQPSWTKQERPKPESHAKHGEWSVKVWSEDSKEHPYITGYWLLGLGGCWA